MFELHRNNIYLCRGDTGILDFSLCDCGAEDTDVDVYPVTAVLSVKKKASDKEYILQKPMGNDGLFTFFAEDTEDTENIPPGKYIYDIELRSRDQVATMGPYRFTVLADITHSEEVTNTNDG